MKVVFDTNVAIPLVLSTTRSSRLYSRLNALGHTLALSPWILAEVREKMTTSVGLRKWLNLPDAVIERFLEDLPDLGEVAAGEYEVHGAVRADPDDHHILAAALESGASRIVTEDRHLLDLGLWRGIRIVDRATMLAELGPEDLGGAGPTDE